MSSHMKKHLSALIGAKVLSVVDDGDDYGSDTIYGLRVKKADGTFAIVWVLRDPEGNGPGFLDFEDEQKVKVGDRGIAEVTITEGGVLGDTGAKFPHPSYIHAMEGDPGVVERVDEDGLPTVRFDRTGTSTLVRWDEFVVTISRGGE